MQTPLSVFPITHAGIAPVHNEKLQAAMNGRSVVRYLRLLRTATIDRLELKPVVNGRWTPNVPTHPAHVTVSALDEKTLAWTTIRDVELPPDPRISGKGLTQAMSSDAMEAHFKKVVESTRPHVIRLGGVRTRVLRVECDREHAVWPNHGEINAAPHSVPFGALDSLQAFGPKPRQPTSRAVYHPILELGRIAPTAPRGMTCRRVGESIHFAGNAFAIGFSLRRPLLLHLGWDAFGRGRAAHNRVATRRVRTNEYIRGVCGPLLVDLSQDYGSHNWTGAIEVDGCTVRYRNLHTVDGYALDVTFTVDRDGLEMHVCQKAARDIPVLEAEAWRFTFALTSGMTGVAAVPTERVGRSGDVAFPALFAGDGNGALSLAPLVAGDPFAHLQVESYRQTNEVSAGVTLCDRPEPGACLRLHKGVRQSAFRLEVASFAPLASGKRAKPGPGLRRHWTSNFSCFRSEWAGFSNHAASCNCHVNQNGPIEVAVFTRKPKKGPDPVDLARFTIGRGLMDGSGYGYWRNLYKDADPMLVMSAGRLHQVRPDRVWLESVRPGLEVAARRMLADLDSKTGLMLCRDLSGNRNTFRWSSNAWDIVGFGHLDAYSNAFTYRALRNATAMLADLGQGELSERCRDAAASIRANYARHLLNPETGWVVCWKSRDGMLHDYASPWINGPACAFGLLDAPVARQALRRLEALRDSLGIGSGAYGVPFMLRPQHPGDHLLEHLWGFGSTEPTFGCFTDGSMGPSATTYYLRALSIHGLKARSKALARDLDRGFDDDVMIGYAGGAAAAGREFLSWDGLSCGYEGTFGPSFGVLYAVAIEQGVFAPPQPEWWPAGG